MIIQVSLPLLSGFSWINPSVSHALVQSASNNEEKLERGNDPTVEKLGKGGESSLLSRIWCRRSDLPRPGDRGGIDGADGSSQRNYHGDDFRPPRHVASFHATSLAFGGRRLRLLSRYCFPIFLVFSFCSREHVVCLFACLLNRREHGVRRAGSTHLPFRDLTRRPPFRDLIRRPSQNQLSRKGCPTNQVDINEVIFFRCESLIP